MRIKVPPFVSAAAPIGTHTIFPRFHLVSGQSQFVVVEIIIVMNSGLYSFHGLSSLSQSIADIALLLDDIAIKSLTFAKKVRRVKFL
jgi:hypothetical protein